MKICKDCQHIKGDECIKYTGPANPACGLLYGQWYRIEDLINLLVCSTGSLTTTTTKPPSGGCSNCICMKLELFNVVNSFMFGPDTTLTVRAYKDAQHTDLLTEVSKGPESSIVKEFRGALEYQAIYPKIEVNAELHNYAKGLDLIIAVNGFPRYARSIPVPSTGINVFDDLPAVLPTGTISFYLISSSFDTNPNPGIGIIAIGGDKFSDSVFKIRTTLEEGGAVTIPELFFPAEDMDDDDFTFTDFSTIRYSAHATAMAIEISGTNKESYGIKIEFIASKDGNLSYSAIVDPGTNFLKTVNMNVDQANENDFRILFTRIK